MDIDKIAEILIYMAKGSLAFMIAQLWWKTITLGGLQQQPLQQ